MSSLVFMVEEPSMAALLESLLPRVLPESIPFIVIPHEGKLDLKLSIPRKLRAWGVPDTRFVVLIDQDANDCKKLKRDLVALCVAAGVSDALVRIVCRSLESWVIGDLTAVSAAFATKSLTKKQSIKKYRTPDRLSEPVRELRALLADYQKVSGARAVAPHLRLDTGANASRSFNVFLAGLRRLVAEMTS